MNHERDEQVQGENHEPITTPSRRKSRHVRVAFTSNDLHLRVPSVAVAWQLRKPGTGEWLSANVGGVETHRFPIGALRAKTVRRNWGPGPYEFMFYAQSDEGRQHPVGGLQVVRVLPFKRPIEDAPVSTAHAPVYEPRAASPVSGLEDMMRVQAFMQQTQSAATRETLALFQGIGQTMASMMTGRAQEQAAAEMGNLEKWKADLLATLDGVLDKRLKPIEEWLAAQAAQESEDDDDDPEEEEEDEGDERITPEGSTVEVPMTGGQIRVDAEPIVKGVVNVGKRVADGATTLMKAVASSLEEDAAEKKKQREQAKAADAKQEAVG